MSKLINEMAEDMTAKIMERNKDISGVFTEREVMIFSRCFLENISKIIEDWVKEFIKEEIKKET